MTTNIIKRLGQHRDAAMRHMKESGFLVERDFYPVVTALQGSQNYGMDHPRSDVDSKFLYMPTPRTLMLGRQVKHVVIMENGEHVEIRPLDSMAALWMKGNINALEVLYTNLVVVDDNMWTDVCETMFDNVGKLKRRVLTQAVGMMKGKRASMLKGTETTRAYVETMGFDGKDLLHILRLQWFIHDYFLAARSFGHSLMPLQQGPVSDVREKLVYGIRSCNIPKEVAIELADEALAWANKTADELLPTMDNQDYEQIHENLVDVLAYDY